MVAPRAIQVTSQTTSVSSSGLDKGSSRTRWSRGLVKEKTRSEEPARTTRDFMGLHAVTGEGDFWGCFGIRVDACLEGCSLVQDRLLIPNLQTELK